MAEVRSGKVVGTLREMGFCFLSLQNSHSPVQIWPVPPAFDILRQKDVEFFVHEKQPYTFSNIDEITDIILYYSVHTICYCVDREVNCRKYDIIEEVLKLYKRWKSNNKSEAEPCVCMKYVVGQIIPQSTTIQKAVIDDIINAVDGFEPGITMSSANWKHWVAQLDMYTCKHCKKMHGQIYSASEILFDGPPVHERCRCVIEALMAVAADMRHGTDLKVQIIG